MGRTQADTSDRQVCTAYAAHSLCNRYTRRPSGNLLAAPSRCLKWFTILSLCDGSRWATCVYAGQDTTPTGVKPRATCHNSDNTTHHAGSRRGNKCIGCMQPTCMACSTLGISTRAANTRLSLCFDDRHSGVRPGTAQHCQVRNYLQRQLGSGRPCLPSFKAPAVDQKGVSYERAK
jgi:hypothetical protein